MRIGQLATVSGVPVETIRYYEKEGLLPEPQRAANNYRIYQEHHLERLTFIRNCRAFDMSLEEIRALLTAATEGESTCLPINDIVREHIEHIEIRIHELQDLKRRLAQLQASCATNHPPDECTIIEGISTLEMDLNAHKKTHLS